MASSVTSDDDTIRQFLNTIGCRRGTPEFFDRFEKASTHSDCLRLHLDVIEVDRGRPTVVFMPDTNAYAILYGEFLARLADRGFNVIGFDPRGHGRSQGARGSYTMPELIRDFRAALQYARKRFGDPLFAAGSSQGGITAFYLAAEGLPLAGAICHNLADLGDPRSVELTAHPRLSHLAKPLLPLAAVCCPS